MVVVVAASCSDGGDSWTEEAEAPLDGGGGGVHDHR
jgi:hypothetical protein